MSSQSLDYFITLIKKAKNLRLREKDVLISRLKGKKLKTLGRRWRVTDERIRQIEEIALEKLADKRISQLLLFD